MNILSWGGLVAVVVIVALVAWAELTTAEADEPLIRSFLKRVRKR